MISVQSRKGKGVFTVHDRELKPDRDDICSVQKGGGGVHDRELKPDRDDIRSVQKVALLKSVSYLPSVQILSQDFCEAISTFSCAAFRKISLT